MRNVGWLSRGTPYLPGNVDPILVRKLEQFAIFCPVMQTRGFHYCEYCDIEEIAISSHGKRRLLGTAEIWVPTSEDIIYAAPDLISHYVSAHSYSPPREFLDAVRKLEPSRMTSAELERDWLVRAPRVP